MKQEWEIESYGSHIYADRAADVLRQLFVEHDKPGYAIGVTTKDGIHSVIIIADPDDDGEKLNPLELAATFLLEEALAAAFREDKRQSAVEAAA